MRDPGSVSQITIVGGGAAGLAVVETVRSEGFGGELVMVSGEPYLPYDRPPLSKQILSGAWNPQRVFLREQAHLDGLGVRLLNGVPAKAVDVDASEVVLADGARVQFDGLVVATGVTPRQIPEADGMRGVHVLRDLDHALALKADLTGAANLVIIGAGVLGCEVAAVARKQGVQVTLVDPRPQPMSRVVGGEVSRLVADLHRQHEVDLCLGSAVSGLCSTGGRVVGVELVDGRQLPADVVLVAIGSDPTVSWLRDSGVRIGGPTPGEGLGGVLCSPAGRAAERIYAAGDVAAWRIPGTETYRRVEHRLNASGQGRVVARALLGDTSEPPPTVPYFWTDQFDIKIQCFGLPAPDEQFEVVEGSLDARKFIGIHTRDRVVSAVVGAGMPRQLRHWRSRVGKSMDAAMA